jgi:carbon monoxide dehydrogenase subunit G
MAQLMLWMSINAPPQAVWDVLSDLDRQAGWMVDVRSLEIASEQKRGAGTVLRVTSVLFGMPVLKDVMEITAWEPPHRMDVVHRGSYTGTGSFFVEARDGVSVFTWREDVRPPFGVLGEIAFAIVVRPYLRRLFLRSMANVKRLAEASTRAA